MQSYNPPAARRRSLGFSLFARHYSGNHCYFLFLSLLRCFSSGGWLPFGWHTFSVPGCPIRKSADIMLVCSSPQLIAAYHVLLRLTEPRHPPYALICFKRVCRYSSFTIFTTIWLVYPNMSKNLIQMLKASERSWCLEYESNRPDANINIIRTFVEDIGVEPMTLCVQGRCSSQLS